MNYLECLALECMAQNLHIPYAIFLQPSSSSAESEVIEMRSPPD